MTSALADLEPKPVWKHFEALAAIPRASTKEAAARDYVLAVARAWASKRRTTKSATRSSASPRTPAARVRPWRCCRAISTWSARRTKAPPHNFDTDPIKLRARRRLAEGRRHHAGRGQRRRRRRRAGRDGEHRHRPRAAGVRLHHRRGNRPDRRGRVPRRAAEVEVLSQPRQRREGHDLHRLLRRHQDHGASPQVTLQSGQWPRRRGASRSLA